MELAENVYIVTTHTQKAETNTQRHSFTHTHTHLLKNLPPTFTHIRALLFLTSLLSDVLVCKQVVKAIFCNNNNNNEELLNTLALRKGSTEHLTVMKNTRTKRRWHCKLQFMRICTMHDDANLSGAVAGVWLDRK